MATNRVFASSDVLRVAVASPTVSGDPVVIGAMGGGVAITDYDADDGKATVDFAGVYDLSVKGIDGAGNVAVAVGDPLYFTTGDTPVLSKKSSGIFFGYALEAVESGATATINVRLSTGSQAGGSGVTLSAEVTGTGSTQNTAHTLGRTPVKAVAILTEFLSNQSVDITEGTHTSTNAVFTVTSGVKYRVMAW